MRDLSQPSARKSLRRLSLLGYLTMVCGLLGLLAMRRVFSSSPWVILLQAAAIGLFVWARITFGWRSFHLGANPTAGGLVTHGPYKHIRHPIYAAVCFFVGVSVAAHWSWLAGLCGAVVLAGALVRIYCEETLVTAAYSEYAQYAKTTWRMVPFVF
jgi:protein-S-isoprenylcysteine O-methyltransferase Ste14